MRAELEASFLANLNQNIRIVHRVCHTYFPRDAMEREDVFQGHHPHAAERAVIAKHRVDGGDCLCS